MIVTVSWNASQSTFLKFGKGGSATALVARLSSMIIGRWSVLIPLWSVTVSQVISKFSECSERKTWSSRLHRLVTL